MTKPRKRHADRKAEPSGLASLDDPGSLRALVRNLREGIYVTDANGVVLDANPAFLQLLGVTSLDELGSARLSDLVVDRERRIEELASVSRDGAVREFEMQIARPDGSIRTVLDTTYGLSDPATGDVFYHGILIDISARKEQEDALYEQSIRDPLTGCYNRRYLEQHEARLSAPGAQWACVFVDIDHFKQYNEEHGHLKGDETLVRMSRFLMRQVRAEEGVVRLGGDEFLVLLEGADETQAERLVNRLQVVALRSAPVPFSLGWAARRPGELFTQAVHRADQGLSAVRVLDRGSTRGRSRPPSAP